MVNGLALTAKSFAITYDGFALTDNSFASTATDNGFLFGIFCFAWTVKFLTLALLLLSFTYNYVVFTFAFALLSYNIKRII